MSSDNRDNFLRLKTKYKNLCRSKRSAFRKQKMIEIEKLKSSKPREFWRYFKKQAFSNNNIQIHEFARYFADIRNGHVVMAGRLDFSQRA